MGKGGEGGRTRWQVKIKGGEFIFALIATEPRNCLTSKIAPAQANYIHLLDLLPPLLFLPPPSYIASFLSNLFFSSLSLSLFLFLLERYHFSLISHRSRLSALPAVDSRFFVRPPTTYPSLTIRVFVEQDSARTRA